jgi:hypothetical protein
MGLALNQWKRVSKLWTDFLQLSNIGHTFSTSATTLTRFSHAEGGNSISLQNVRMHLPKGAETQKQTIG